jgi:DNA-binding transcriptional LysR family regulator
VIQLTLIQLQVFLTIVKEGSFTKAGDRIGMSQSAVSHIVSNLEDELGVKLLERNRKGVKLTQAGEQFLYHVRTIIYHVDEIEKKFSVYNRRIKGTIKLGTFPSVSQQFLPRIISSFQNKYPSIDIVMLDGTNEEVRNWIQTGVVDIGFVSLPDEKFDTVPIKKDEILLIMPVTHPLSSFDSISVTQIINDPFIMTKGGCKDAIVKIFHPLQPKIIYEVKETSTILTMVEQGIGLSILPKMAIPANLFKIHVAHLSPKKYRHLGLGMKSKKSTSPAVLTFIEHINSYSKYTKQQH